MYLSEFQRQTFVDAGIDEDRLFRVGPLAADLTRFRPTDPPTDAFVMVAIADMQPLKGTNHLLDAWDQLDLPDAHLVLVGGMTETVRADILPRVRQRDAVEWVGHVDDPERYLAGASVFVHPSLTEGFAKFVPEAMASGLPVVITEHCQTEYVADAIAAAIEHLYANPDVAREMGRRGRAIVEQHTWEDFSDRIRDVHLRILEREGHV
jgi:glycosyltransferase involved in cell wall biosynthesis